MCDRESDISKAESIIMLGNETFDEFKQLSLQDLMILQRFIGYVIESKLKGCIKWIK